MTITLPDARPIGWDPATTPSPQRPHPSLFDHLHQVARRPVPQEAVAVNSAVERQVRQLAVIVIEVLTGRRPHHQLTRWMTEHVQAQLVLTARRLSTSPTLRVASVHVQQPSAVALEATLRVEAGQRSIAMAFRMSRVRDRWMCTVWEHRIEDLLRLCA